MKKIAILFCIFVIIATDIIFVEHSQHTGIEYSAEQQIAEEKLKDNTISITVSAVGDCTFASDIHSTMSSSFKNVAKTINNNYSYYFDNVKEYFANDDMTIINLECSISSRGVRSNKKFAFRGDPEYINIMTQGSVEAANFANNHFKDYGEVAVQDTKDILCANGISGFGFEDVSVVDIKGVRVGLIGISALNSRSRNEFPALLEKLKIENPDIIVASFHWGTEKATVPDYTQKMLAHKAIDSGVDLVIGHHPHVLQGIEKYNGKYILYSLGNFCFGGNTNPVDKDTMIFTQTFKFKDGVQLDDDIASVIPCSISSVKNINNYQPTPLWGADFLRVKDKIIKRSSYFEGIEDIEFVEATKPEEVIKKQNLVK